MSGQELTQMVGVMVSFVLLLGLLGFFCVLLNLRDRRRTRVLHAVLAQIGTPALRGRFTVQVRADTAVNLEEAIGIRLDPGAVHIFDADSGTAIRPGP